MDDEEFVQHMEGYHPSDLRLAFGKEPEQKVRRLREPLVWRVYHNTLHRLTPAKYDHAHEEESVEPVEPRFEERKEQIWMVPGTGEAYLSEQAAEKSSGSMAGAQQITLYRPTLAPIYGGETLKEALWAEMDRLMEALMTGTTAHDPCGRKGHHGVPAPYGDDFSEPCEHEDNGDKYRAQELAWVIAITSNPYAPSVDQVRAEAMSRWEEQQAQAAGYDDAWTEPQG